MFKRLMRGVTRFRVGVQAAFGSGFSVSQPPPPWILRAFGMNGPGGGAGYISEQDALRLAPVLSAVDFLADMVKKCPVALFKRTGESEERDTTHPVAMLLMEPNAPAGISMRQLMGTGQLLYSLYNNAYQQIVRDPATGAAVALWPLDSATTQPLVDEKTQRGIVGYRCAIGNKSVDLPPGDVIHVRKLSLSGWIGESPIKLAQRALQSGSQMEQYGLDFFLNESRSGGFFVHPGKLSPKAKGNIGKSVSEQGNDDDAPEGTGMTGSARKHHGVKILEEGMKYIPTTIAPEEAQFLQSREFSLSDVARIFRMPLILLQSIQGSSVWGTGIDSLITAFVRQTIEPLTGDWADEMSHKLLTTEEREQGFSIKIDTTALTQGDAKERAETYNVEIKNKSLTVNEARRLQGRNPLPGGDDPSFSDPPPPVAPAGGSDDEPPNKKKKVPPNE